jgi:hypothetical protein
MIAGIWVPNSILHRGGHFNTDISANRHLPDLITAGFQNLRILQEIHYGMACQPRFLNFECPGNAVYVSMPCCLNAVFISTIVFRPLSPKYHDRGFSC